MCTGCDGSDTEDGDIRSEAGAEESVANCADYDGREIGECELRLHDGRRVTCAVLIGFRKGGLSCDWANAAKPAEKDGVAGAGTHGLGVTEAKEYIMDDDDTIAPGWSLAPADICIGTGEFLTNGDVGIIPDPDKDPDEDLKAEAGEWGMPLQRELRATLHSYMED